ncbi:MAG TPA: carotenoid 1,2-hydratase [Nitrospirales bacterium]|nr:carotenoid 1,2-hydratase [Nitrospirales bacterium]
MRILLSVTFAVLACAVVVSASERKTSPHEFVFALPGYQFSFPQDHGSHNSFQTEWWYYSGQVRSGTGQAFGYQLTFFRHGLEPNLLQANPSRWAMTHLYFAHFALTDIHNSEFWYAEKLSRATMGKAGADSDRLSVWVDNWSVDTDGWTHYLDAELRSTDTKQVLAEINFELVPEKPPIVHGTEGISKKGAKHGQASHYYSMPRLRTTGRLTVNGEVHLVNGMSWLDHEFGTNQLGSQQVGWDWFGLQLDDGSELMLYQLRRDNGTSDPASSGSLITPDAQAVHISSDEFRLEPLSTWTSPKSNAVYPSSWRLTLPGHQLILNVVPYMNAQELVTEKSTRITYWEGAVRVHGQKANTPIQGQGYMEMTGYAEPLNQRF